MTAEEKLKKLLQLETDAVRFTLTPTKRLNPKDIDLIANLVVERIKEEK